MDTFIQGNRTWPIVMAVAMVMTLAATQGVVRAEDDAGPDLGRISLSAGVDIATQYWFRGLAQENQGSIAQPWAELGFNLFADKQADLLNSIDINVGLWNSFHGGPSGDDAPTGSGITDPMSWYEADWYAGLGFTLADKWSLGVTWTTYTSPNDAFTSTDEIAVSLGYDDAGLWGEGLLAGGLQPSATVAFEYDGGADAGTDKGIYYELALGPSWSIVKDITLSVPMKFGFGSDYYEDGLGNDHAFGYFDVGADVAIPLKFIPADYGSWNFTAGVHMIVLGDTASTIAGPSGFGVTGGNDVEVYGIFGISFEY